MKILFSDEKLFDIDGVYNSQNDRIWAVNPSTTDTKDGIVTVSIRYGICIVCRSMYCFIAYFHLHT